MYFFKTPITCPMIQINSRIAVMNKQNKSCQSPAQLLNVLNDMNIILTW